MCDVFPNDYYEDERNIRKHVQGDHAVELKVTQEQMPQTSLKYWVTFEGQNYKPLGTRLKEKHLEKNNKTIKYVLVVEGETEVIKPFDKSKWTYNDSRKKVDSILQRDDDGDWVIYSFDVQCASYRKWNNNTLENNWLVMLVLCSPQENTAILCSKSWREIHNSIKTKPIPLLQKKDTFPTKTKEVLFSIHDLPKGYWIFGAKGVTFATSGEHVTIGDMETNTSESFEYLFQTAFEPLGRELELRDLTWKNQKMAILEVSKNQDAVSGYIETLHTFQSSDFRYSRFFTEDKPSNSHVSYLGQIMIYNNEMKAYYLPKRKVWWVILTQVNENTKETLIKAQNFNYIPWYVIENENLVAFESMQKLKWKMKQEENVKKFSHSPLKTNTMDADGDDMTKIEEKQQGTTTTTQPIDNIPTLLSQKLRKKRKTQRIFDANYNPHGIVDSEQVSFPKYLIVKIEDDFEKEEHLDYTIWRIRDDFKEQMKTRLTTELEYKVHYIFHLIAETPLFDTVDIYDGFATDVKFCTPIDALSSWRKDHLLNLI